MEKHDRTNANVYVMEIIALDATLNPAERRNCVAGMTADLKRRGLAYVVGIHKPDPSGDQRNFHVHIMYSLRPAERHAPYDWSFAVSKVVDINTPAGILVRRRVGVDATNATLAAAGSSRRYTAVSNRGRGIVDTPRSKAGQRATWVVRRLAREERKSAMLERLQDGAGRP